MSRTVATSLQTDETRVKLDIWHPDCWGLQATAETNAGLIAHTFYNTPNGEIKAHLTAFGDRTLAIDNLVEVIRASPFTYSVSETSRRHNHQTDNIELGNTMRELFVKYSSENSISDALVSHGFIHDSPIRIQDGREYWSVVVSDTRSGIQQRLDEIQAETDGEFSITKICSTETQSKRALSGIDQLSPRQREVFERAREHDYYAWPRGITTRELAAELDISKTTMLEHLRKAEAKLLGSE